MSKQIVITITDDPANDSCDVRVAFSPDMDRLTFAKMITSAPPHFKRLMREGFENLNGMRREAKNSIYSLFGGKGVRNG